MKQAILNEVRRVLRERLERLARAAMEAHAAATDPGSKAEGKYDTRSLEASYLAAGQARQVDELADALRVFEGFRPRDFAPDEAVDAGALVETDAAGETAFYLLAPAAGGLEISAGGADVTVLTPASALYRKLLGARVGDAVEGTGMVVTEVF